MPLGDKRQPAVMKPRQLSREGYLTLYFNAVDGGADAACTSALARQARMAPAFGPNDVGDDDEQTGEID